MKLILVDPNAAVCEAWRRAFHVHPASADGSHVLTAALPPEVEIQHGVFQDVVTSDDRRRTKTCLVTAGNSFGLMDGGVDLAVARRFPGVERRVQEHIRDCHHGELLVGAAIDVSLFDMPDPLFTFDRLIYAPTMRVPMSIVGTDAVYRAMWATLNLASDYDDADQEAHAIVVVPGLGTGAGRMSPDAAAQQMALAWRNFHRVPERMTWPLASLRHHEIAGRACCEGRR